MASKPVEGEDCDNGEISGSVSSNTSSEEVNTKFGAIRRRGNRNKKITCKICFKFIQSNHLTRHMKVHRDLYLMDEEEPRREIRLRKELYMEKEKKQLLLDTIAHDMEAPQACIEQDTKLNGLKPLPNINYDELERELRLDHKEYQQMIERGKMINKVLEKGEVDVEGLSKHNRKALDMYIKRKPIRDYTDIVLRAW